MHPRRRTHLFGIGTGGELVVDAGCFHFELFSVYVLQCVCRVAKGGSGGVFVFYSVRPSGRSVVCWCEGVLEC